MTTNSEQVIAKTDDPGLANLDARIVTAIYGDEQGANAGRRALIEGGFDDSVIEVNRQPAGVAPEYDASITSARGGLRSGVLIGAVIGLVLGVVVAFMPDLRAILPIHPALAIVFAALIGAAFGSLVGSFGGLGVRTEQVARVEQAARAACATVAVRVSDPKEAEHVATLLRATGPREIAGFQEAL